PNMDGYEFVRQLRSEPDIRDSAIILSTGAYEPARVQPLADALGVRFVLTKPLESEQLIRFIDAALGMSSPPATLMVSTEFDQAHFRLVADKLTDKVAEVQSLSERLTTLVELSLQMNVDDVLWRFQDIFGRAGRELLDAEYAAVGIFT